MAGIMILINGIAVFVNFGKTDASGVAIVSLVASIFAFGIFANFRNNPMSAPTYAVVVSTLSGVVGAVCLVIGLVA